MSEHKELMRNLRFVGGPIRLRIANSIADLLTRAEKAEAEVERLAKAWKFMQEEKTKANEEARIWFGRFQRTRAAFAVFIDDVSSSAEVPYAAIAKARKAIEDEKP